MSHAHGLLAEGEPLLVHVEHGDRDAGELDELDGGQADRAGADDEHVVAGLGIAAGDGMAADGQRLDQGELFERELA